eukprot:comp22227_c0_seq1/m.32765 comp22227_c0_seq1/g.32765  ORF comp22227_c0_seq1/g.32765 comp22227_c0_seq1/m.32765 type:complete len:417 (-) comp22227_c0_seq1:713-1963(-)
MDSPHPGPPPQTPQTAPAAVTVKKRRADDGPGTTGGRKKKKALDRQLPQQIKPFLPESELFTQLVDLEKRIDVTITRKRIEMQSAMRRTPKATRTVRMFLSSREVAGAADGSEAPGWQLRVEGRLLDEAIFTSKARRRFSSFFSKIFIEFKGPGGDQTVEWVKPRGPDGGDVDGFEIKRAGQRPTSARLFLYPESVPPMFKLAPPLARLLGVGTQTKHNVLSSIWGYIKTYQLQDKDDKTLVNCNQQMQEVFGCTHLAFSSLPDRLLPLLSPMDPVEVTYGFGEDGECYDMDVDIDDVIGKQQLQTIPFSQQEAKDLADTEAQVLVLVKKIRNHSHRRDFMSQFSDDPIGFIHKWIGSQHRDLQLMQDGGENLEEQRRAEFYNKAWVEEATWKYLADKTTQQRIDLERQLHSLKTG